MFLYIRREIFFSQKCLLTLRQLLPGSLWHPLLNRKLQTSCSLSAEIYYQRKYEEEETDSGNIPRIIKYASDHRIIYSSYVSSHKILNTYSDRRKLQNRVKAKEKQKLQAQSVPLIIEKLAFKGERGSSETELTNIHIKSEVSFPYSVTEDIDLQKVKDYSDVFISEDPKPKNIYLQENIANRMQAYEEGRLLNLNCNKQVNSKYTEYQQVDQQSLEDEFGSADPSVPMSDVPCGGCGAQIHCQEPSLPGFLPKELFQGLNRGELRSRLCQRCFFLKHRNIALNVRVSPEVYTKVLEPIKEEKALAIVVLDLLDIPCSIWPGILHIIGTRRPVVVVGNKVDLLPADGQNHLKRVRDSLISAVEKTELGRTNIKYTALVSAHTGYGIETLITKIQNSWGMKGDIYILGCTNAGKSTLFNALLRSDMCKSKASDLIMRATTSPWPGTTLNMLKFPILRPSGFRLHQRVGRLKEIQKKEQLENEMKPKYTKNTSLATLTGVIGRTFKESEEVEETFDPFSLRTEKIQKGAKEIKGINPSHPRYAFGNWCYDTPGTVQPDQIINLLTHEELLKVLPKKIIQPRSFSITSGKSLFLGGLARLDVLSCTKSVRLTVFTSGDIPINIVKTVEAASFYRDYLGSPLLGVPVGHEKRLQQWPALKPKNMFLSGIGERQSAADVVLSSAGWIAITGSKDTAIDLRGWAPGGRGIYLREPSILPFAVNLKGGRIGHSPAYKQHKCLVPSK